MNKPHPTLGFLWQPELALNNGNQIQKCCMYLAGQWGHSQPYPRSGNTWCGGRQWWDALLASTALSGAAKAGGHERAWVWWWSWCRWLSRGDFVDWCKQSMQRFTLKISETEIEKTLNNSKFIQCSFFSNHKPESND